MINIPRPGKNQNKFNKPPMWPAPHGFNPLIPGHLIDPTWPDPGPDWQYWVTAPPRNGGFITTLWILTLIFIFGGLPIVPAAGIELLGILTTNPNNSGTAIAQPADYTAFENQSKDFAASYKAYTTDIQNIDINDSELEKVQLELQYTQELQGHYKAWAAVEAKTPLPTQPTDGLPSKADADNFSKANKDLFDFYIPVLASGVACLSENPVDKNSPNCVTVENINSPAEQDKATTIQQELQTAGQKYDQDTNQTTQYATPNTNNQ